MQERSFAIHDSTTTISHQSIRSQRVRFAGPLDDRVIEDSGYAYSKAVLWAALVGICYVLIGTIVMITSIYSCHRGEFHGALFSMAYHFCAAEGILGLSSINGWATPMRKYHRHYAHALLQTCTVACALIGVMVLSVSRITGSKTTHGLSGLITLVLTAMAWVVGPFLMKWVGPYALRALRPLHFVHKMVGLLCFFMSTVCLSSGIVTNEFNRWIGKEVVIVLLGFIIFYTFIIIYTSCMKYVKMMF